MGFATYPPSTALGFRPNEAAPTKLVAFHIQSREVSRREFTAFDASRSKMWQSTLDLPATGVPWREAQRYCIEHRHGRLPTDAEWELAARGSNSVVDPWFGTLQLLASQATVAVADARLDHINRDGGVLTALGGNVLEWTTDTWSTKPQGDWNSDNSAFAGISVTPWKFVSVRGRGAFERDQSAARFAAMARRPVCVSDTCERPGAAILRSLTVVVDGEPPAELDPFVRTKVLWMLQELETKLAKKVSSIASCSGDPNDGDVAHDMGMSDFRSWKGRLTADVSCGEDGAGDRESGCYYEAPGLARFTSVVALDVSNAMGCVLGSPNIARFSMGALGKTSPKEAMKLFSRPSVSFRIEVRTYPIAMNPIVENIGFRCVTQTP
jgi:hypothetical protein